MVRRLISFLGKEISGLHEAAYLLGFFAILSQILALVRDRLLAHGFGAGTTLDLYYAAFRIPDFLFAVIASLFSASVLIPFLSEKVRAGSEPGREFLSVMFSVFLLSIAVASGAIFFAVPWLVPHLFPGFADEPFKSELILMTRILLLSPIFLGLSNLFASVTQLYNRFFIYGISPILYNVGIIVGITFLAPRLGPVGLVWGVVLGALLHLLIQAPFVAKQGLFPKFVISFKKYRDSALVILLGIPRTFALSAQEVSKFFLISLASLLGAGSISVFSFSHNLQSVPLSIIGASYSLAAFPALSAFFAAGERERFVDLLRTTSRYVIFFSLPLIALFIVLRAHFVRVVLGSGAFSWQDTRLTAAALAMFALSLAAQGLILVCTRARYASQNTKTPFYINIASSVAIIIFAVIFSRLAVIFPEFRLFIGSLFRVEDVAGAEVLMLPLAFSVGSILGALAHIYTFDRDYGGIGRELAKITAKLSAVAVAMGLVSYITLNLIDDFLSLDTFVGVLSQGLIAGFAGVVCGIILLALSGSRELAEVSSAFHRKFWKTPVIGPDPNAL